MIRVTLTPTMIEYADNVAAVRQGTAFLKQRPNANGLIGSFDQLLAIHRQGARCEAAGKVYLNPIRWHALAEHIKGLPDLGDFIDVKGCSRDTDRLILQRDCEDDFAYLQIFNRHPGYFIGKWCWGFEGKQEQFWDDPKGGRPAYFVTPWRDPEELFAEVRLRQGDKIA